MASLLQGVEDSEIALGTLRSRDDVDKSRIFLMGHSMGHDSHNDSSHR